MSKIYGSTALAGYCIVGLLSAGCSTTGIDRRASTQSASSVAADFTDQSRIGSSAKETVVLASYQIDDERQAADSPASPPTVIPTDEIQGIDSTLGFVSADVGMTLEDFQSLAFSNNPTIRELAATTRKAAGFRTQVGLRANPTVGYQANQLADQGTDQHTAFVQQTIITAGKLELNRQIMNEALRVQLFELEAQKIRVATDIRVSFFEALADQRRVRLIHEFQSVTDKGLELAELRQEALEGSKVDVLQAKVQKNEIDLALQQAEVTFSGAWRALAAIAGLPELPQTTLQGELPESGDNLDWSSLSVEMIAVSPEYHAAQARIGRAQAAIRRHGVQAIPNITAQLAAGVDNGTNSGLINLQFGVPIPVFNKNQGNIVAARAEYCRAVADAKRVENSIKARLALVSRDFDASLAAVSKYSLEILPSAEESLKLAEMAYKAGETSFVQVLVARRTFFDTNLQFVLAQAGLAQARSKVDGYVLTGSLDPVRDESGNAQLRGLTFGQR